MNSDENPSLTSDSPRFDADDLGTPDSVESNPTATTDVYEDVPDDEPTGESAVAAEPATETLTAETLNEDVSELADDVEELSDEVNQFAVSAVAATDAPAEPNDQDLSPELLALQQPFVGRWNGLVSTTNWEKGRIISQWRAALIEAGAPSTEYSDEAWASRVGGVTAPHVGRLRRVFDRFAEDQPKYEGLYWSHFLAALDWDDAALWLQGAVEEKWSVSNMRDKRWKANGEVESQRPTASQVMDVDLDEDQPELADANLGTAPAQGDDTTRDYDGDTDGVQGPTYEGPDFGEEEELNKLGESGREEGEAGLATETPPSPLQPFAGLPELPDDLSDVVEQLKLSILRHKSAGFNDVSPDVIRRYLEAVALLIES
ncbi:MAG: hypothetical protein ACF8AM_20720 [Rhodopirellula sp. JB055]|uniref:hypothetical protein n=1 Tax=Rhodopirellula sp. JB055 TaxID=3342846 RepID=UPI00370AF3F3